MIGVAQKSFREVCTEGSQKESGEALLSNILEGSDLKEKTVKLLDLQAPREEREECSSKGIPASLTSKKLPDYFKRVTFVDSAINELQEMNFKKSAEASLFDDTESELKSLFEEEEGLLIENLRKNSEVFFQEVSGEELINLFEVDAGSPGRASPAAAPSDASTCRESPAPFLISLYLLLLSLLTPVESKTSPLQKESFVQHSPFLNLVR